MNITLVQEHPTIGRSVQEAFDALRLSRCMFGETLMGKWRDEPDGLSYETASGCGYYCVSAHHIEFIGYRGSLRGGCPAISITLGPMGHLVRDEATQCNATNEHGRYIYRELTGLIADVVICAPLAEPFIEGWGSIFAARYRVSALITSEVSTVGSLLSCTGIEPPPLDMLISLTEIMGAEEQETAE